MTTNIQSYSYFGARYYLSDISIWASVDPMADDAPGWTPYRYCFNNPIMLTDPDGMSEGNPDWYEPANGNQSAKIWMPGNAPTITVQGETYKNIGTSYSRQLSDGKYANNYQNYTVSIGEKENALSKIAKSDALKTVFLKSKSVSNEDKSTILKSSIYNAQNNFIRGAAEITSDATGKVGLGAQAVGAGLLLFPGTSLVGAGLISVGNGLTRISSAVDFALDINDGNNAKAIIDFAGFASGSGIKYGVSKLRASYLEKLYLKTVGGIILSTSEMGADKVIDKRNNKK